MDRPKQAYGCFAIDVSLKDVRRVDKSRAEGACYRSLGLRPISAKIMLRFAAGAPGWVR
jgi:hypothetical protein